MHKVAWAVSLLLQPHLKPGAKVTPESLLGKTPPGVDPEDALLTPLEKVARLRTRLAARHEARSH